MRIDAMTCGTTERNYGLDVLKIVATVIIVFHHYQQAFDVLFPSGINFYGGSWFHWGLLVELFFTISGYVTAKYISSIENGEISLKNWYFKRTIRLLPLVAVSVLVYEALLYIHAPVCGGCTVCGNKRVDVWEAIITALGMQAGGVFKNPMINNPLWYISVLIIIYVVFYIITIAAKRMKVPVSYVYIFMILLGCGIKTYGINLPFLNELTGRGYSSFFLGVLMAVYIKKYGVSPRLLFLSLLSVAVCVYLCLFHSNGVAKNHGELLSFIMFPALVFLTESKISRRIFCHRFWGIWGQCSFGAYIWHMPVMLMVAVMGNYVEILPLLSRRGTMYLLCLAVEIIGVISFYCLERPLNKLAACLARNHLQKSA